MQSSKTIIEGLEELLTVLIQIRSRCAVGFFGSSKEHGITNHLITFVLRSRIQQEKFSSKLFTSEFFYLMGRLTVPMWAYR